MDTDQLRRAGGGMRGVPAAVAAALVSAALAYGTPAAAAALQGVATVPHAATGPAGTISTVAGSAGGPGKATTVGMAFPCGVSFGAGHLYASAGGVVREVNPGTDRLTTPAGTGTTGPLGDGGEATQANVGPCGTAVDHVGNLVIADTNGHMLEVVAARTGRFYGRAMKAGHIYRVAGTGQNVFSGNGGPATKAGLRFPQSVAVDAAGNLVFADSAANRVRVVAEKTGTFYGRRMTAGHIYALAGGGRGGDGGPAGHARLHFPHELALDAAGNVLIADSFDERIRVVAVKTGTFYGQAMTAGHIYTIAGTGAGGFSGDGGPATSATFHEPGGVALDAAGNVLIADTNNVRVRVVAESTGTFYGQAMTAGDIYTIAGGTFGFSGDDGPATSAAFDFPVSVAVDAAGNVLIADINNERVRVVAVKTGTFYGQAMTTGDIYTGVGNGTAGFSGDRGPATQAQLQDDQGLGFSQGVAVDGAGNLLIADSDNLRIRVAAKTTGTFYGQAMTAGHIYTIAGTGAQGFSGDGGPATQAKINVPQGVTADAAGNVLFADWGNNRIRVIAVKTGTFYGRAMTAGHIYTVAGGGKGGLGDGGPATGAHLDRPGDVSLDGAGNLLIADANHNRVRVVAVSTGTFYGQAMTAGNIYTVAGDGTAGFSGDGGPATSAELSTPLGATVDAAGNLVISDHDNSRVRVVAEGTGTFYGQAMTAGNIYTVAGDGTAGFSGDGGPATSAALDGPGLVAVDTTGNLVVADTSNGRVRVVAEGTGTFYGQAMTAGNIYTVAGNGTAGFSGDGGPATSAELKFPGGVAVNAAGDLLIADSDNNRIRMVTG